MLGGFEPVPKFKRIFHPSEYNPKLAVVIVAPILFLVYGFLFFLRLIKRR